jgi:hypothetical protein
MTSPTDPHSFSSVEDSKLRTQLRELQWQLPLSLQSVLLRFLGPRYDPYSEWHRQKRAIFAHIPRTAGTSFALAAGTPKQHVPMSRYAARDPAAFGDYFKFCFVRNPWDRLLSAFSIMNEAKTETNWPSGTAWARKHLRDYPDFESFVLALRDPRARRSIMAYSHFRPQLDWLTLPRSSKIHADFVGRFERLEDDFSVVTKRPGLEGPLPVRNASAHRLYREVYSRDMRRIVEALYAADIAAFDYAF